MRLWWKCVWLTSTLVATATNAIAVATRLHRPIDHEDRGGDAGPHDGDPGRVGQLRKPRHERQPEAVVVGDAVAQVVDDGPQVQQHDEAERDSQQADGGRAAAGVDHPVDLAHGRSRSTLRSTRSVRAAGVAVVGDRGLEVPGLVVVRRVGGDPVEGLVEEVERRPDAVGRVALAGPERVAQHRQVDQLVPVGSRPSRRRSGRRSPSQVTRTMSARQVLDSRNGWKAKNACGSR